MSKVVNAPSAQNSGGYEQKVAHPVNEPADKTAGKNTTMAANLYEQRCSQEVGAH